MKYEKTEKISFPLGGIGTGCIGLAGNGGLIDWEILNRPNKNSRNGYSHFAIKAIRQGKTIAKILQGDTNSAFIGAPRSGILWGFGHGVPRETLDGLPHFKNVQFDGAFPIAKLTYEDENFPAILRLCAFNPLIPHDTFNSSLPVAFFEWEIENTVEEDVEYTLAFSVANLGMFSKNIAVEKGCMILREDKKPNERDYFDLSILTDGENVFTQEYWKRTTSWLGTPIGNFWDEFSQCNLSAKRTYENPAAMDHATVSVAVRVPSRAKKKIRFVLAWNVPNQYNYWYQWSSFKEQAGHDITWKNYYATKFEDSMATAKYALLNFESLLNKTECFNTALHSCSLPDFVIEAISANLSVLKSPTVLRLEDGSIWGWEGVNETVGSCEGSCQHVWNYAYAVPFLFPELERSMRENNINYGLQESGQTTFRVRLPLGEAGAGTSRACLDGQMGEVIKCYREWKISGDTEWLKKHAEAIFSMLEFAWSEANQDAWDFNQDGVIEGRQHHTLDVELFGASSWLQGFYLLALDCASKMAEALGETERLEKYQKLYRRGKAWTNEKLFNGEYFGQQINLTDKSIVERFSATDLYWDEEAGEIRYQIGEGCIIDQLLADWHSTILGMNEIFDSDKKSTALQNLYKYNYKASMRDVVNPWRNFCVNDEAGTLICTYPEGKKKPAYPIPYFSEIMTGFEYALGGLMISQGFIREGETIVKAVRNRYDGKKRNPWNEIECGSNYARSMASYALLPIYSGFTFDMTKKHIGFEPIKKGDCRYLWSVGDSWGVIKFEGNRRELTVFEEMITLSSFGLRRGEMAKSVIINDKFVDFHQNKNIISFQTNAIKKMIIEVE